MSRPGKTSGVNEPPDGAGADAEQQAGTDPPVSNLNRFRRSQSDVLSQSRSMTVTVSSHSEPASATSVFGLECACPWGDCKCGCPLGTCMCGQADDQPSTTRSWMSQAVDQMAHRARQSVHGQWPPDSGLEIGSSFNTSSASLPLQTRVSPQQRQRCEDVHERSSAQAQPAYTMPHRLRDTQPVFPSAARQSSGAATSSPGFVTPAVRQQSRSSSSPPSSASAVAQDSPKSITSRYVSRGAGECSPSGTVKCPVPGCIKALGTASGIRYHIATCHSDVAHRYTSPRRRQTPKKKAEKRPPSSELVSEEHTVSRRRLSQTRDSDQHHSAAGTIHVPTSALSQSTSANLAASQPSRQSLHQTAAISEPDQPPHSMLSAWLTPPRRTRITRPDLSSAADIMTTRREAASQWQPGYTTRSSGQPAAFRANLASADAVTGGAASHAEDSQLPSLLHQLGQLPPAAMEHVVQAALRAHRLQASMAAAQGGIHSSVEASSKRGSPSTTHGATNLSHRAAQQSQEEASASIASRLHNLQQHLTPSSPSSQSQLHARSPDWASSSWPSNLLSQHLSQARSAQSCRADEADSAAAPSDRDDLRGSQADTTCFPSVSRRQMQYGESPARAPEGKRVVTPQEQQHRFRELRLQQERERRRLSSSSLGSPLTPTQERRLSSSFQDQQSLSSPSSLRNDDGVNMQQRRGSMPTGLQRSSTPSHQARQAHEARSHPPQTQFILGEQEGYSTGPLPTPSSAPAGLGAAIPPPALPFSIASVLRSQGVSTAVFETIVQRLQSEIHWRALAALGMTGGILHAPPPPIGVPPQAFMSQASGQSLLSPMRMTAGSRSAAELPLTPRQPPSPPPPPHVDAVNQAWERQAAEPRTRSKSLSSASATFVGEAAGSFVEAEADRRLRDLQFRSVEDQEVARWTSIGTEKDRRGSPGHVDSPGERRRCASAFEPSSLHVLESLDEFVGVLSDPLDNSGSSDFHHAATAPPVSLPGNDSRRSSLPSHHMETDLSSSHGDLGETLIFPQYLMREERRDSGDSEVLQVRRDSLQHLPDERSVPLPGVAQHGQSSPTRRHTQGANLEREATYKYQSEPCLDVSGPHLNLEDSGLQPGALDDNDDLALEDLDPLLFQTRHPP